MKALKEKRIGLRSLWRRGLVILSLFALVFASCDHSGPSPELTKTSGKVPLEIRVKTQPSKTSYEGIKVDTTGLTLEVRYADAPMTWVTVTDLSQYGVLPKYTQRNGNEAGGATTGFYRIYAIGDGTPVYAAFNVTVSNLVRSNANSWTGSPDAPNYPGNSGNSDAGNFWAQGVQVYLEDGYKKIYRVDDFPDFSHIKLQGNYRDGTTQNIPIDLDMRWEIRPRYDKKPSNETGKGDLVISVGGYNVGSGNDNALWGANAQTGYAPPIDANPVSVMVPLDAVYHVTGLEIANPDDLRAALDKTPVFYWSDDRPNAWLSLDGTSGRVKDAILKVTYSDTPTSGYTRNLTMADAVRQNTVYYNANPNWTERPITVQGINDSVKNEDKVTTFWPNHRKPQIYFYYRGYKVAFEVPVFTRFSGLTANPKVEGDIVADMRHQDNDYYGRDAAWFASQIEVKAQFSAYSDPSKTTDLTLSYQGPRTGSRAWDNATSTYLWTDAASPDAVWASQATWDTDIRNEVARGKPYRALGNGNPDWNPALTIPNGGLRNTWDGNGDGNRQGPYPTGYNSVRIGMGASGPTATSNLTYDGGPTVYSMNFGDPDYTFDAATRTWKQGDHAWGESSVTGNNGRTRNVTIYYTPGLGPTAAGAGSPTVLPTDTAANVAADPFYLPWAPLGPAARTARVPVAWSGIPLP